MQQKQVKAAFQAVRKDVDNIKQAVTYFGVAIAIVTLGFGYVLLVF